MLPFLQRTLQQRTGGPQQGEFIAKRMYHSEHRGRCGHRGLCRFVLCHPLSRPPLRILCVSMLRVLKMEPMEGKLYPDELIRRSWFSSINAGRDKTLHSHIWLNCQPERFLAAMLAPCFCFVRFQTSPSFHAGHETKAMLNNSGPRYKRSKLERRANTDVLWCVLLLVIMCLTGALGG